MIADKICSRAQIAALAALYRQQGKRVVFTNGCFDILHAGHALYLQEAGALGDVLIVGMNSDAGIRRLKGAERPIIAQEDRAILLAALASVHHVVAFDEDTPYDLIREIQPDVLVKGGDWPIDSIVGADIVLSRGGKVESIMFREGISSTIIIDKIKSSVH